MKGVVRGCLSLDERLVRSSMYATKKIQYFAVSEILTKALLIYISCWIGLKIRLQIYFKSKYATRMLQSVAASEHCFFTNYFLTTLGLI